MIRSLTLINFRSHLSTHLEFRGGTNLIIGIMGCGKSSVLDAISFAIFGTFPALERRKVKLEDLVRLNEINSKVILEFEYEKNLYKIERIIERSKRGTSTSAELFKNGSLLEHGTSAVTSYLENLLSIDYDLFTRAIYCEQNNVDHFLSLDPRRRKTEIDSLLGLDKFESARANLVTIISRTKSKKDLLSSRFDQKQKIALEKSVSEKEVLLAQSKERLNLTKTTIAQLTSSHQTISKDHLLLKEKKMKLDTLSSSISMLTGKISALESGVSDFDPSVISNLKAAILEIEKSRSDANSKLKSIDGQILLCSREISRLEGVEKNRLQLTNNLQKNNLELSSLLGDFNLASLESKISSLEAQIISASTESSSILREISELSDILPKMKDGLLSCPICSSSLSANSMSHFKSEKEELLSKKKSELSLINAKIQNSKSELETTRSIFNKSLSISQSIASLQKLLSSLEETAPKILQLKESLVSLSTEKDELSKATVSLNENYSSKSIELSKLSLLEKRVIELKSAKEQLSSLLSQQKSIDFDQSKFESLRNEIETLSVSIQKSKSEATALELDILRNEEMLQLIKKDLASFSALEKEILEISALEDELISMRTAIVSTQTTLRTELIGAINAAMNEIWSIFYPYRNYSSVRVLSSEKDYLFEVENFGSWKNLETLASGGERASFALVLRVALSIVLSPKIGLLLLDEPTHNLDRAAVELLSNTLQFKVPQVIDQAFVITHEEGLMGSEFGSSYRFTRDKSIEGETKIERI